MRILCRKKCLIGEGPIWNEKEQKLYFTNGLEKEICSVDFDTGALSVYSTEKSVAAICFDRDNCMIVSGTEGVFRIQDGIFHPLYDPENFSLRFCNDAKVGPDGCLYVGTQSEKRMGISDAIDGKLYRIEPDGNVQTLLEGLRLSNGMDWSMDEKRFFHTDSDTQMLKEYDFDKDKGTITYTGRSLAVPGIDGFTIDENDFLYIACWGKGCIAVTDSHSMEVVKYIPVPTKIPASCAFAGATLDRLVIVSASINAMHEENAGMTFSVRPGSCGRAPYRFGKRRGEEKWNGC